MYGSSLTCVTRSPRASSNAPTEALASPLPIDETTPPVTNTYLVGFRLLMPDLPISTPERTARERERWHGVGAPRLAEFSRRGPPNSAAKKVVQLSGSALVACGRESHAPSTMARGGIG